MTSSERSFEWPIPRAETWWPYVTLGAREAITRDPRAVLSSQLIHEIRRATGVILEPGASLSEDDRRFVQSQTDVD